MKKINSKKFLFIIFIIGIILVIINFSNNINKTQNVVLKFSKDYNYFDNSIKEFAPILINDLKDNNVKVVSYSKYYGDEWADLYRYDIRLDNGDVIYLSSEKENIIQRIIYRGNIKDTKYTGKFLGIIARLYIKKLNASSFEKAVNSNFLSEENLNEMFGESYVYSHIKFDWFRSSDDSFYDLTFSVVPEENEKQYKERLEKETIEQEEKSKQENTKDDKEEEQIIEKNQIFTAGEYKVGIDIKSGTYNMIAMSGRGNCYVNSSSNVMETFTPGGDEYAIDRYNNVKLSSGDTIKVTNTLKIKFEFVN